jgi:hypothetical protein
MAQDPATGIEKLCLPGPAPLLRNSVKRMKLKQKSAVEQPLCRGCWRRHARMTVEISFRDWVYIRCLRFSAWFMGYHICRIGLLDTGRLAVTFMDRAGKVFGMWVPCK